jgi:xylulokinase
VPPVVAGGGGDNAASACGVGAVAPGAGFLSLGTSGVLFVSTAGFAPNTGRAVHAFCHAVPGTWHQMAVILAAADSLSWLSRLTGQDAAALAAMVDPTREPEATPLFLPYLSGERTPHNDPGARGAFLNLGQESDAAALARAVLEGVAYAFADGLDALRAAGTEPGALAAVGGGARSDAWLQIIADATGLTLERPQGGEAGAALGAARLGLCAAEGLDARAVCTAPALDRRFEPRPAQAARHLERRARFAAAYAATAPLRD